MIVLLRPEADGPAITGALDLAWSGAPYLSFAYRVVRTWEQPVEAILAGGLGTPPLAPIADAAPEALPSIIRRMGERLAAEAAPGEAATLWAATYILAALRYPREVAQMIRSLGQAMRESWAYQEVLDEGRAEGEARGRAEEERRILLRLGTRRLGPPDAATAATLRALSDIDRVERMTERLLDATSWADVLSTP